jgi:hypothetical protein
MIWKDYLKSVLWGVLTIILVWGVFVIGIGKLIDRLSPHLAENPWVALFMISLWILSLLSGLFVSAWRASIYSRK